MRDFFKKIKNNKIKISIVSSTLVMIIATSVLCGALIPSTSKQVQDNTYYYKPGEIRFDDNGNLLIPKVLDENNPLGIYEHNIPEMNDTIVSEEIKNSKFYKEKLDILISENKNNMCSIFGQEVLETKIVINDELINFSKYFIPELVLEKDKEVKVQDIIDQTYSISVEKAKTKTLSNQEISDMLAINGINFDKLYNDAQVEAEKELNTRGGGGSGPSVKPPHVDNNFTNNPTISEARQITEQDISIRKGFAIAYSAILPTLTIASGVLAFFTCGISVAAIIADIAFSALEIGNAWAEFYLVKDLKSLLWDIAEDQASEKIKDFLNKIAKDESLKYLSEWRDSYLFKFLKTKKVIKVNLNVVKSYVSAISMAVKITMPILEDLLMRIY